MLTLRIIEPALARSRDRRLYESAYALPTLSEKSSFSSSESTATLTSSHNSSSSQRSLNLTVLASKKKANQKRNKNGPAKLCFVCWSNDCKLKSHHEYASQQLSKASIRSSTKSPPTPRINLALPIGNGRLDPFTALPVEGPTKEAMSMFRDFFTNQTSQIYQKPKRLAFDSTYTPLLIQQAYSDPATCHSCLAMSATYMAVHGQNLRAPDEKLSAVYEAALRALRAQLIREKAKPRATTVMAAVNLIMAQAIGMCNKEALEAHRTGIQGFVEAWGGIHNLEPQLVALIIWTDYWATLFTGLPPLYSHLLSRLEIKLERPPQLTCGSAFEEPRMRGLVSSMLLENCQITCRLLELVQDKVKKTSTPARWQYFTYRRDCMATRNAVVHAELFATGTKAECVGLTMNMILLLTLRMVPWKSPGIELCDQIKLALIASGAVTESWRADIDVLLYILFVVCATAVHWDHKTWSLDLLQQTLEVKYGNIQADWPLNWEEQEVYNLKRFAWSDVLLSECFNDTCHELSLSRHSDLEDDIDEEYGLADDEGSD